jgi:hypothetical protein
MVMAAPGFSFQKNLHENGQAVQALAGKCHNIVYKKMCHNIVDII